jgi:hypothetical protein
MSRTITDDVIKLLLGGGRRHAIAQLKENDDAWMLGTFGIKKHSAGYTDGWGHSLRPESRFYKRWFEFPEIGARGWAIIFRIFDPVGESEDRCESFPGWVPPDREAEADRWIEFLNAEIAARLREAEKSAAGS